MGHIIKRVGKHGVRWQGMVRMAGYPTLTKTGSVKSEILLWMAETEEAIRARRYKDPRLGSVEFGVALERYLQNVTTTKAVTTQQRERRTASSLLRILGQNTPLNEITPSVVARLRDDRLASVSAYSVRLELALLSDLFNVARTEWELPVPNPVADIRRPKAPSGRMRFLTPEDAKRLLDEAGKRRNKCLRPYLLILLQSGMRPSEAAGIRVWQVDLSKRRLMLDQTKNDDPRGVPLTDAAVDALRPLIENKEPHEAVFLTDKQITGSYAARPNQAFKTAFGVARKEAGLDWLRMHDIRHTAASWMLMRGVDLRSLAEILGHRTLQMVMRYTHLDDAHLRAAVETIGDLGIE